MHVVHEVSLTKSLYVYCIVYFKIRECTTWWKPIKRPKNVLVKTSYRKHLIAIQILTGVWLHLSMLVIMKGQFVVTHRDSLRGARKKAWQIINRPALKHVIFLRKYKENRNFCVCVHTIFTDGVFLTQMSSDTSISLWLIV